jgi:hypothetical protein
LATVSRKSVDSVEPHEKVLQLIGDMKTQGARLIAVANSGDQAVASLTHHIISIEESDEPYPSRGTIIRVNPGRYLWHCHILEHEANDIIQPYEVLV